jgi:low molecular weight protein-tyrosine phosphatase
MDRENLEGLLRLAADEEQRAKVRLLREFDPASAGAAAGAGAGSLEVPDPYYGAAGGFEEVLDQVEAACGGLLEQIRSREPA